MGVDVSFHIEVRRKNVWRPFIWQTPMEFCSDILKKDEEKEWQTNTIYRRDDIFVQNNIRKCDF